MYNRIVVALDGSPLAERVLPRVEPLAEHLGSRLLLLRAVRPPGLIAALAVGAAAQPIAGGVVDPTPVVEADERETEAYLRGVVERLRARGLAVDRDQRVGSAAEVIVAYALEYEAGMIAMTTHGRGGLGRAVFGSVADAVLRQAPCPVLLVRVAEEPDA
jgi:nucleotide-binding universal stress UspA family protein